MRSDQEGAVRIIELDEYDGDSIVGLKYAALSHCWGGQGSFKLQTSNLSSLTKGIQVDQLPKTFQDAIQVCKYLRIQFLWIDSLCILQDSKDDWRKNAAAMYDFYHNSEVTLFALDAANSDGGLSLNRIFGERLWTTTMKISGSLWRKPQLLTEWLRHDSFATSLIANEGKNWVAGELEGAILLTRAWVFQERMAARCKIFFGRNQLFWECQHHTLGEAGRLRVEESSNDDVRFVPWLPSLKRAPWDGSLPGDPVFVWHHMIERYTSCALTEQSDRLVAISGVARMFQSSLSRGEYLAGLWSTSIVEDLAWYQLGTQPASNHTPSWTWASVEGGVRYSCSTQNLQKLSTLIDAQIPVAREASTSHAGSNTPQIFGDVSSGSLHLQGPLHMVEVTGGGYPSRAFPNAGRGYELDIFTWILPKNPTDRNTTAFDLQQESLGGPSWKRHRMGSIACFLDIEVDSKNNQFWLLALSYTESFGSKYTSCLVLVRNGDRRGEYRRVGLADIGSAHDRFGRGFKLLSEFGPLPADATVNETSSGQEHEIVLV
ncbi:MAG: hypothetical protein Q9167_007921 [Letrouitia subvulpina]